MPYVQCENTHCIHCDLNNNYECTAPAITISEDLEGGCSGYVDYHDQLDYHHEYYIAVKTISGELAKAKMYRGKRIEHKGRVFYTNDRLDDKFCTITDAETGVNCGPCVLLKDRFDDICAQAQTFPKVETLPEAEWTSGGYEIVKEGTK